MTLPITIAWLIHQCLGERGRRPLIGYAVASGILIHMIGISGDGVEHSVVQIFRHTYFPHNCEAAVEVFFVSTVHGRLMHVLLYVYFYKI